MEHLCETLDLMPFVDSTGKARSLGLCIIYQVSEARKSLDNDHWHRIGSKFATELHFFLYIRYVVSFSY